jgi:hypothetical protein
MKTICTPFSEGIGNDIPLKEHPNPYFERKKYLSLNGYWDFDISCRMSLDKPTGRILVPFSPETPLSGVEVTIKKDDIMHYHRLVVLPDSFVGTDLILHFLAIDQKAYVYINGVQSYFHVGGYCPFSLLLKDVGKSFDIDVLAEDNTSDYSFPRGKQSLTPGGIWYHATSGIYQSVYLESVPKKGHIDEINCTGDYPNKKLFIQAAFAGIKDNPSADIYFKGKLVATSKFSEDGVAELDCSSSFHPYSNDSPDIYDIVVKDGDDEVTSHYSFRSIEKKMVKRKQYLFINGEPVFLSSLLDQGYWPESGLTPPSFKAYQYDIELAKRCGFNSLRKHIKVEMPIFYYLCEKEGIYVAQDFVNGGAPYSKFIFNTRPFIPYKLTDALRPILGRKNEESKNVFRRDLERTYESFHNFTSIILWTIFNEGWGQFDAKGMTNRLRILDPERLIDSTSGWFDQGVGDFSSYHIYFRPPRIKNDHKRLLALSETGGYTYQCPSHIYSEEVFSYRHFKNLEKLNKALERLFNKHIARLVKKQALSFLVYTQLSDVEEEVNGLVSYDRKVIKVDEKMMNKCNLNLYSLYKAAYLKASK